MSKYDIVYKNTVVSRLNKNLIISRNISDTDVESIKELHVKKLEIIDKMNEDINEIELRYYASEIENIEYLLQDLWKFQRDKNFHKSFELPKCSCPKMDNYDLLGYSRIIDESCVLHN